MRAHRMDYLPLTEIARAWVRKQRIDFFCVVSTEVLMHFFFFYLLPLTNN